MPSRRIIMVTISVMLLLSCTQCKKESAWSWEAEVGCNVHRSWGFAVDDEQFYLAFDCGQVLALNKLTGQSAWTFTPDISMDNSTLAVTLRGDVLYVYSLSKMIYALDAGTGNVIWQRLIENGVFTPLLVSPQQLVLVALEEGHLLALDGLTGDLKWEFVTGYPGAHPILVGDETALIAASDSTRSCVLAGREFIALNLATGREIWHRIPEALGVSAQFFSGSPACVLQIEGSSNDGLYFVAVDNTVVALQSGTGEVEWRWEGESLLVIQVLPVGDKVIIVSGQSATGVYFSGVIVLDKTTGEEIHTAEIANVSYMSGASERYLYLGCVCYPIPGAPSDSSGGCDIDYSSLARFDLENFEQPVSSCKTRAPVLLYDEETGIALEDSETNALVAERPW